MSNYNHMNKSGPVSESKGRRTNVSEVDGKLFFELEEPCFGVSLTTFGFGDYWNGMESEIFIADDEFVLLMRTIDSKGFDVHTPVLMNYPIFLSLYRRVGRGVQDRMRGMEHRLIPLIERFLEKCADLDVDRLVMHYFSTYEQHTVDNFKLEVYSWDWVDTAVSLRLRFLVDTIQVQSGEVSSRQRSRLRRDLIQRELSYKKQLEDRKKVPKSKRRAQVKKAQKEATARRVVEPFDEIQLESGLSDCLMRILALPVDAYRTCKRFAEIVHRVHTMTEKVDAIAQDEVARGFALGVGTRVLEAAMVADERSTTIVEAVQGVANAHRSVTEEIQSAIRNLTQALSKDLPKLVVNCMVACLFVYLFTTFTAPVVRLAVLSLAGVYFAPDVYNLFAKAFRLGKEAPQAEVIHEEGFDHSFFVQVMSLVLAGSIFAGGKPPGYAGLFAKIVQTVGSFPRINKGIDALIQMSMSIIEAVINEVRRWMKKNPVRVFKRHAATIEKLIEEALEFEYALMCGKHGLTDAGIFNKVSHFVDSFMHLRKTVSHDEPLKRELDYFIVRFSRHAEPYKVSVSANGGYRAQPVTLVLAGDPGIGKTMCTQTLCLTLMKLTGHIGQDVTVQEASRSVFVKPANSKYMDGYTNNFAYLIDDLFQIKPLPGVEGSEEADIMTYHGSFNASLNMADCPKKGMYPFTSKLILATTNCRAFSQIGLDKILLDVNAFQRRLDFHVIIQVKPEFRLKDSTMLDHTKFVAAMAEGPADINQYPWHAWEWVPTTFAPGSPESFKPGTGRCMRKLIWEVAERIKLNAVSHETTMHMFNNIVTGKAEEWIKEEAGGDPMFSILKEMAGEIQPDIDSFEPDLSTIDEDEMSEEVAEEMYEALKDDVHFQKFVESQMDSGSPRYVVPSEEQISLLVNLTERKNRLVKAVRSHFSFSWEGTRKAIMISAATVLMVSLGIKLIVGCYEWIKEFFFGPTEQIQTESNGPKVRTAHCFKQEMITHQNGNQEVTGLWYNVYKNTFKGFMDFGNGVYQTMGQVLVLKGNTFVMPCHFLRQIKAAVETGLIKSNGNIVFRSCALQRHSMTITVSQFLNLRWHLEKDKDLAFSSFGDMCPPKKDITKFILPYSKIKDLGGKAVRLDTARASHNGELLEFSERISYFCEKLEVARSPKYIGEYPHGTNHKDWLSYRGQSQPGDCGAVLSVTDYSSLQNKFVCGLHIGRRDTTTECYATQLDIETVNRAFMALKTPELIPEVPMEMVAEECGWASVGATAEEMDTMPFTDGVSECFGSFVPVCTVTPGIVSPQDTSLEKTQLGKEVFFKEQIKSVSGATAVPELEVMKLRSYIDEEGKVVLPMAEALKPFAGDTKYVDPSKFKTAVFAAMHPFSVATRKNTGRKLTFEEAVLGCPEIGLASIPRSTSLGYPWCTKKRDKTYFFGKGEEYDLSTPEAQELKKQVLDLEKVLLSGRRPLFVCRDFLKDEVRKKGKGARLIAGTDVRYYILCRMYFGAYTAAIISTHQETGMCLGVNQYSEWGWLRRFITKHGDRVWDGDFERFDSKQQPQMLWAIFAYISVWYLMRGGSEEENEVRRILYMDLVNSRHLVGLKGKATAVVEWVKSLPSGHFLTGPVNTTYGMSCIAGGFIALTGHIDVWNYIAIAEQGDDNVVGARDEVTDRFNQVTLAKFLLEEYDMVYTAGRKGEALKPYMNIEEVTFLQRRFAKKEGVDVCPIRPESFLHSLYYTKKNKEEHIKNADMICGLERALEELALHEEKHWKPVSDRIVEAMDHYDYKPMLDTTDSSAYLGAVLSRVPEYL